MSAWVNGVEWNPYFPHNKAEVKHWAEVDLALKPRPHPTAHDSAACTALGMKRLLSVIWLKTWGQV